MHFLGNVRSREYRASKRPRREVFLRGAVVKDLRLWLRFLDYAGEGMTLNLMTIRFPTNIGRSDACEHGIGGYSLITGNQ